ncbi:hypothetical protein SAMN04487914_12377 [Arthrobacter sp. ok909]|uniref:hypothetical protein n=1 Tax=Arthrobacter sp. ok909 TaxID=1761746 RepID=UPI00087E1CD5|nr:hypothetical protein [Arthrobacter sp. ok909]SDP65386.1 hypothetical protein SAMN04487914_12377 [Arthrobacter sp. ok909]
MDSNHVDTVTEEKIGTVWNTHVVLKAYVDESAHVAAGLCLVGVAVLDKTIEEEVLQDLQKALPRGAKRLHWNKDGAAVRSRVVEILAERTHHCRVYLSYFDDSKRSEKARDACLAHMFADMGGRPYGEIILDQRTKHQDTRDLVAWTNLCVRLSLPHPPVVRHDGTTTEPLLWLADALAGAVGEHLVKGDDTYVRALAHKLEIV